MVDFHIFIPMVNYSIDRIINKYFWITFLWSNLCTYCDYFI